MGSFAVLHIDGSAGWQRAELLHTDFRRNRARAFIIIVDACDDALDFGRVERPPENQFAGAFGESPPLGLRSQRAQDLEILPLERRRSEQPPDADRNLPFYNGTESML